ncbi:hypothetical protein [Mucilaginibacter sp. UYCu711]|uniref:hypothetical protein n=1 Tax=Mucilaginibacter sp. UYCu711 TaxID=3156339 RepID=UPI003D231D9C
MKETDIKDDLASIRSLMERSSKFISLSGLSGILAGVYALVGAIAAYKILQHAPPYQLSFGVDTSPDYADSTTTILLPLILVAITVLAVSILTAIILSYRKAQQKSQPFWSKTSKALLFHMATPLLAGGLLIIIFIARGYFGIVAPASLIFYGLSLVSASNFTFNAVKSLGLCEIVLGLISALYPGYGLYFWAIGFGVLHIIYGSVMYLKYDR